MNPTSTDTWERFDEEFPSTPNLKLDMAIYNIKNDTTTTYREKIKSFISQEIERAREEAEHHLRNVLPMAMGYANTHDVGNNRKMIVAAQVYLNDLDYDATLKDKE